MHLNFHIFWHFSTLYSSFKVTASVPAVPECGSFVTGIHEKSFLDQQFSYCGVSSVGHFQGGFFPCICVFHFL